MQSVKNKIIKAWNELSKKGKTFFYIVGIMIIIIILNSLING